MADLFFYLLSAVAIAFAVGVVVARNPLISVLSLLGAFFCLACIFLLAGFQFLAATQLLVYAGAIMVLFLFVVMLLNLSDPEQTSVRPFASLGRSRLTIAVIASGALGLVAVFGIGFDRALAAGEAPPPTVISEGGHDRLEPLAEHLFSHYVLPFEAASLLLLATMIAVIVLAKRQRPGGVGGERIGWPYGGREVSP